MAAEIDKQDVGLRTIGRAAGFHGAMERLQLSIDSLTSIAENEAKKPGRKLLIWAGSGWPMMDSARVEISDAGHRQFFNSIVALSSRATLTAHAVSMRFFRFLQKRSK